MQPWQMVRLPNGLFLSMTRYTRLVRARTFTRPAEYETELVPTTVQCTDNVFRFLISAGGPVSISAPTQRSVVV